MAKKEMTAPLGFNPAEDTFEEAIQAPANVSRETSVAPMTHYAMDDDERMIADLTTRQVSYCSMVPKTQAEKVQLYNAQNNPEKRIKEEVNMEIAIKDVYVEVVQLTNQDTYETTYCPRIVLIDKDNVGHQCVSFGVYSAVKRIFKIFGEPTYTTPITVRVRQLNKGNNRNPLTLDIVG